MTCPTLQIAVVGGSIAGCCAALELARAGHHVEIFERSPSALVGQGAGIGLLPATLDRLIERDLVDEQLPRVAIRDHVFAAKSALAAHTGRESLRLPMSNWSVNWADLHANLRKRVSDGAYHAGVEVRAISEHGAEHATLSFAATADRRFDLVLFADGHASLGRRSVCPDRDPAYRGYVLWRGVLDLRELADPAPLQHSLFRVSYGGPPGHAMMYRIPGGGVPAADGCGLANFGCYVPVAAESLADLLVDRNGRRHASSLSAGEVRPEEQARLRALVQDRLPGYFGELLSSCGDMFVQAIFSVRAPRHRERRVCLLGDAGTLVPPLTGSGVLKAVSHALDLAHELSAGGDVDDALAGWDRKQTAFGDALFALGEHMERALIWDMVDFAELDAAQTSQWWQATTSLPR